MSQIKVSPTQERILAVLADGQPHPRQEVVDAVDIMTSTAALSYHIRKIRDVLRPLGHDVVCRYSSRKFYYQHVRLLSPSDE